MTEIASVQVPVMPEVFTRNLALRAGATRPDGRVGEDGPPITEGERNTTFASLAGTMNRRGMTPQEILAALRVVNTERCRPPLPDAEVDGIVASISNYPPADEADGASEEKAGGQRRGPAQAARLVALAADVELFHDAKGEAFATATVGGHQETWPVGSRTWRERLVHGFYIAEGAVPSKQAVQDAVNLLEAKAKFDGPEHAVHLRVAPHAGDIYIDLCNERWQAIQVSREGWEIVSRPPGRFRRAAGMLPLPRPKRGGSLEELHQLVNVPNPTDWLLVEAFLLGAFDPNHPYPVLVLSGEQGSGKSSLARFIKDLVDPNAVPLRSAPGGSRDLMIAAQHGWLLAYDNLSRIPPETSDDLCRLATGGGLSTRVLYTDDEEIAFQARRPVMVNGIEDLATRPDLLDRSICVHLPPIPPDRRRDEEEVTKSFDEAKARIFGAILDALVGIIATIATVTLTDPPRMADFAKWVTAAEPTLALPSGAFMKALSGNRATTRAVALDASPITPFIIKVAEADFCGTASELLEKVNTLARPPLGNPFDGARKRSGDPTSHPDWPKDARGLSGLIRRLAPDLRAAGLCVDQDQTPGSGSRKLITLRITGGPSDASDASDANPTGVEPSRPSKPQPLEGS